jgi:SAM-dependent methyltransferase
MNERIGESRFWEALWKEYRRVPSVAFCRVPELEYASQLNVSGRVLDHCCGDGRFAMLAWPGQILSAGCDLNPTAIARAGSRGQYARLDVCDVAQCLPYDEGSFDLVFDNSALEHVADLTSALAEVSRVLAPGGVFAFNVLNHRYFEWWPLDESAKTGYRNWQPFHHALTLDEWTQRLAAAGLKLASVEGYFNRQSARELARLDCEFSGVALAHRPSNLVRLYKQVPLLPEVYWKRRLASLTWKTEPDDGAGYFIRAVHAHA